MGGVRVRPHYTTVVWWKPWQRLLRLQVLRRDDFTCCYCGVDLLTDLNAWRRVSIDHLVPKASGGRHTAGNLVACCETCNNVKADTSVGGVAETRELVHQRRAFSVVKLTEQMAALGIRFHDLRRAFVTMNADRLTGDALQALMRHKSYLTTQKYINMARQLDRAVESLHVPEVLQRREAN